MSKHIVDSAEIVTRGVREMSEQCQISQEQLREYQRALESVTMECDMFKRQLDKAMAERDYYQRYSIELTVNINNIASYAQESVLNLQQRILTIIEQARAAPMTPTAVTPVIDQPEPVTAAEAGSLEHDIQQLNRHEDPPEFITKRSNRKHKEEM